jgi:hypothetical protein
VKDPHEVLIPGRDLILIALREHKPDDRTPFAPLVDPPLHLGHGSAINGHR